MYHTFSAEPPGPNYRKPFYLAYYNQPKLPSLKKIHKSINITDPPKHPVRWNTATKMRNKVIEEYSKREKEPIINYSALTENSFNTIIQELAHYPTDTKASQYRYKWIRDIPVVSCRFTEHMIMFKKPPFTFTKDRCTEYKLRTMKLEEPRMLEDDTTEKDEEIQLGILQ